MVKDIADSKRVNTTIRDKKQREDGISVDESSLLGATVVSRHYWPPFKGEEVELHGRLKEYYDDFSNEYRALKAPRSVEWKPQLGFVEIEIETGRTHQIRIHTSSIGHPVVGDSKYGVLDNKMTNKELNLKRLFLHAYYLSFYYDKKYEFILDLPGDLKEVLSIVGNDNE